MQHQTVTARLRRWADGHGQPPCRKGNLVRRIRMALLSHFSGIDGVEGDANEDAAN